MTQSLEIGTKFWQIYQGYTGKISKTWEVISYQGDGIYTCKALSDNTVEKLTDGYTEDFSEDAIDRFISETPIIKNKKGAVDATPINQTSKDKVMETTNQKLSVIQKIDQVSAAQIPALPEVADRFMHLYSIMHGRNLDVAKVAYESEKFHFAKLLQDKPELQKCTKLSLYGCFIDMAVNGLSFDPAMKHAYIVGFPTNVGTKDNPKWETRASVLIDGRGELVIRTRQGQIKYADNPVVVWSCDSFTHGTKDGRNFVEHSAVHPRPADSEIIACYLKITRPDDTINYSVMDIEDVMNLKAFSKQPNSLAWTKGLKGMVETKTLKHAFKSYPKIKLGNFSKLQTQVVDAPDEVEFKIDYGLNGSTPANLPEATGTYAPSMIVEPVKDLAPIQNLSDDSFMQEETVPAGAGKSFDDDNF